LEKQAKELQAEMNKSAPHPVQPPVAGRKYVPSPKHEPGGWGTPMDLNDTTAQAVLNAGVPGPNGKQIYGLHDGRIYEFQPDNVGGFHGYPVPGTEVPPAVLRQWRDQGLITE